MRRGHPAEQQLDGRPALGVRADLQRAAGVQRPFAHPGDAVPGRERRIHAAAVVGDAHRSARTASA